jgi:hypothetical protein
MLPLIQILSFISGELNDFLLLRPDPNLLFIMR